MKRPALVIVPVLIVLTLGLAAQSKPPATFADYGKWEVLAMAGVARRALARRPVLAYAINRSNRDNDLVIATLAGGAKKVDARLAPAPVFSSDSTWVAYGIGQSEAEQEKLRADSKPVQNKLGLLNLAHGRDDHHRRRSSRSSSARTGRPWRSGHTAPDGAAPAAGAAAGGGGARGGARGGDTRRLPRSGRAPRSSSATWRPAARPRSATSRSSPGRTPSAGTCWRSPSARVGKTGQRRAAVRPGHRRAARARLVAVGLHRAWRGGRTRPIWRCSARRPTTRRRARSTRCSPGATSRAPERLRIYDPLADKAFPAGMRTVSARRPSWSDDGRTLFVGIAKWDDKPESAARGARGGAAAEAVHRSRVWHAKDIVVMPKQKIDAPRTAGAAFSRRGTSSQRTLVPLAKDLVQRTGDAHPAIRVRLRGRVVGLRDEPDHRPAGRRPVARRPGDRRAHPAARRTSTTASSRRGRPGSSCSSSRATTTGRSTSPPAPSQHHQSRPHVLHRQGVGPDEPAEAALRRGRLDEGRWGGAAERQVRRVADCERRVEEPSG